MKKFRKVLSAILVFSFCLLAVTSVSAENIKKEKTNYKKEICNLMIPIMQSPNEYGLGDLDFNNLYLGKKITPYSLNNNIPEQLDFDYYPILNNNRVVCIATVTQISDTINVQIGKDFSNELQNYITENKNNFALVYYDDNLLIKNPNDSYKVLYSFKEESIAEDTLTNLSEENLKYAHVKSKEKLDLSSQEAGLKTRAYIPDSKILNVPYKYDSSGFACWASAVASIGHFKRNINKTTMDVTDYLGVTGDKNAGSPENVAKALNGMYQLKTTKVNSTLNYTSVTNNVVIDKPIYSVWKSLKVGSNGYHNYHAVVACGYTGKLINGGPCSFTYVDCNYENKKVSTVNTDGKLYITSVGINFESQYYLVLV